jgi:hypothetical protein
MIKYVQIIFISIFCGDFFFHLCWLFR